MPGIDNNEQPAGVPEGAVLNTTDPEGTAVKEVVVHDGDGTWHKEVVQ